MYKNLLWLRSMAAGPDGATSFLYMFVSNDSIGLITVLVMGWSKNHQI